MSIERGDVTKVLAGGSLLLGGGTAGILLHTAPATAATIEVTNENDAGAGALRYAIDNSSSGDVITFASNVHSIQLTSGRLEILHSLTLQGPGAGNLTIHGGGGVDQIFYVYDQATMLDVTMSGLTLSDATQNAIVNWNENLTLTSVDVTNNVSTTYGDDAAVLQIGDTQGGGSTLTITNCNFSGNVGHLGGALNINTTGTGSHSIITGSTFVNNSTANDPAHSSFGVGAGIRIRATGRYSGAATVVITDTLIEGNANPVGNGYGAGIAIVADTNNPQIEPVVDVTLDRVTLAGNTGDSAISDQANGVLTILQSTISGNSNVGVQAVPAFQGQTVNVEHSTIAGNGGQGLLMNSNDPTVNLDHALLAGNGSRDVYDASDIASANFSIVERKYSGTLNGTGNIEGVDPNLEPFAMVSPTVGVRRFADTSAAFNAGDPSFTPPPATDQAGQPRVAFGRIDIGAWELPGAQPQPTTTSTTRPADPVVPTFTG